MIDAGERVLRVGRREVRVSYHAGGDRRARPLLMLMGLGGNIEMWEPLRGLLDRDRSTVAFDVPGTGDSPAPALPLPLALYGWLALRVLDRLGLGTVDVLGMSWGGLLAQQLLVAAPGRVGRAVLASTNFGWGSAPGTLGALRTLGTTRRYHSAQALQDAVRTFGGRASGLTAAVHQQNVARLARPPSTRGYYCQIASLAGWSSLPWLPLVQQPTLVLTGDDDPAMPLVNARVVAAAIPHALLTVVPGGGHLMLFDQADEMAPVISGFLDAA